MQTMANVFGAEVERVLAVPPPTPEEIAAKGRAMAEAQRQEQSRRKWEAWHRLTDPMGRRYQDCTLENFQIADTAHAFDAQRTVLAEVQKYAANIVERIKDGVGLVLYGPSGTGKDHLLTGLSRVAVGHELSIKWINGSTLYRTMREGIGDTEDELVQRYMYPAILYISDPMPPVGSLTPFQASALFAIVDGRYRGGKATWASMNVTDGQEASQRLGAAIADRLRDGAITLCCNWESHRKALA